MAEKARIERRWILWLLLIIFAVALILGFPEIRRIVFFVGQAQWQWVLVAAFFLISRYVLDAILFKLSFDIVNVESRLAELVPLVFVSLVVNLLGIAASGALFADDAAQRGQSPARATAGIILVLLADYINLLLYLIAGLAYLAVRGVLSAYQIFGGVYLLLFIAALSALLLLGRQRQDWLRRFLTRVQRTVNDQARRFGRKPPLAEIWAGENAAAFMAAARATATRPQRSLGALGTALAFHTCGVLGTYALFPAYRQPIEPAGVIAGYAVGLAYWIIGITPQGVGVVEGAMALTFVLLGVPVIVAGAIALAFRGLSFWLPLLIGTLFLLRMRSLRQ